MKAPIAILSLLVFAAACGGPEASPERAAEPAPSAKTRRADSPRKPPAQPPGDPCAPLRAKMVRHDTAGTPFAFTFEMPEGFTLKDFSRGETVGTDVTFDLDGKGGDEYVLRLAYNVKVLENQAGLVDTWRKLPLTEKVLEKEVDGRTMYVQKTRMGDMTGFNVLFPAFATPSGSHLVLGGITSAPKPCRTQAAETVERMLMSFERNPRVGEIPAR